MRENLRQAFIYYIALTSRVLKAPRADWSFEGASLKLDDDAELRLRVDFLEKGPEFKEVVKQTDLAFAESPDDLSELFCASAVRDFFRRSGCYLAMFDGEALDLHDLFHTYCDAFQRKKTELTYLAPIEFVRFAEPLMDFKDFAIQQFTNGELDRLLQNRTNRVFYPYAATNIEQLSDYWFIVVREPTDAAEFGGVYDELWRPEVSVSYTPLPRPVENVVKVLALFDWQANVWPHDDAFDDLPNEKGKRWLRFNVPFVLRLDDNLLKSPATAPDVGVLETEPRFDPRTGEERGPIPVIVIDLDNGQPEFFRRFIERILSLLSSLDVQSNRWQFLEVALGYLIKAFFAEGLEQLLWHITSLEALLGEKGHGVTRRLTDRVASILGNGESEGQAKNKQLEQLYNLRCDLVHGRQLQKQAYVGHLREARDTARKVAVWFLYYLAELQVLRAQNPSTRDECLGLLDKKPGSPLLSLLDQLPRGFPHVPEWLE